MINNAGLIDKGIMCLVKELGVFEAEQFVFALKSEGFDYTEWRKDNLCTGMSVEEISAAADAYCKKMI